MPTPLKCSNCGASIRPDQDRCNYCGLFFQRVPSLAEDDSQDESDYIEGERTRLQTIAESFQPIDHLGYKITEELDEDSLTLFFLGEKSDGELKFEGKSSEEVVKKIDHYEKHGPRLKSLTRMVNRSGIE